MMTFRWTAVLGVVLLAGQVFAGETPDLKTPMERQSYGLGVDMGKNLKRKGAEMDPNIVVRGMKDAMKGDKLLLTDDELLAAMRGFAAEQKAKPQKDKPISGQEDIPSSQDQKTLHTLGLLVSRSLTPFNLNPAELEFVKQGITDASTGKSPAAELSANNEKVQELFLARRKAQGEKLAGMNKDFLDKAAKAKGTVKTGSGLIYLSLKDGSGASPKPTDTVKVNYRGTFPDGKEFDSSYKQGEAPEMKMDGVIKCWKEGLQKMKKGGKAKLVCPPDLAYGDVGAGDLILPYATLVFEVELLEVKK